MFLYFLYNIKNKFALTELRYFSYIKGSEKIKITNFLWLLLVAAIIATCQTAACQQNQNIVSIDGYEVSVGTVPYRVGSTAIPLAASYTEHPG